MQFITESFLEVGNSHRNIITQLKEVCMCVKMTPVVSKEWGPLVCSYLALNQCTGSSATLMTETVETLAHRVVPHTKFGLATRKGSYLYL